MSNNQISEIKNLDPLKSLGILYMDRNKIAEIPDLNTLPNLAKFYLDMYQIERLPDLTEHPNLKYISLMENSLWNPEDIKSYLYQNRITINIYGNPFCDELLKKELVVHSNDYMIVPI